MSVTWVTSPSATSIGRYCLPPFGTPHKQLRPRGAIPIALGGDHFIASALARGYREATGGNIGYIQLSSRLDLGLRDPAWGDVWRGATVRRLLDSGTVHPKNLVWIGSNGYVPLDQWQDGETDCRPL